jgi:hypothetical protein
MSAGDIASTSTVTDLFINYQLQVVGVDFMISGLAFALPMQAVSPGPCALGRRLSIIDYQLLTSAGDPCGSTQHKDHSVDHDLDLVVTANMVRTAIRARLGSGITQHAISELIARYARDGAARRREEGGIYRLPVEVIPHERRAAFLDALNELPEHGRSLTQRNAA